MPACLEAAPISYRVAGCARKEALGSGVRRSRDVEMQLTQALRSMRRRFVKRAGFRLGKVVRTIASGQSLVEDRPIHDSGVFPFLAPIEANWTRIRAELDSLLRSRANLPAFHQISPDQRYISKGDEWKVFILFGFGVPSRRNCARCPETARLLRESVPGLQSAWFSILAPHYHIPRHRGISKTVLRVHLGLIVPVRRDRCVMQVDDRVVGWEPGKCLVFDDFYRHEVWNDTDEERVVLIFDFDRPMRPFGRVVNKLLMWGIKRTAYFKDAERNLKSWDERLESAVQISDKMLEDDMA
ncbi:MAG TPA: aspartyl/asparaginyl beta-hydroxylase domain-containing protein [Dongiaceae bacterium]|nr:aspartyl/asparaginyl beta-hydroxylase domain-containing protein [Dongiaceae bacterium]